MITDVHACTRMPGRALLSISSASFIARLPIISQLLHRDSEVIVKRKREDPGITLIAVIKRSGQSSLFGLPLSGGSQRSALRSKIRILSLMPRSGPRAGPSINPAAVSKRFVSAKDRSPMHRNNPESPR